jgi:hypothetical protein
VTKSIVKKRIFVYSSPKEQDDTHLAPSVSFNSLCGMGRFFSRHALWEDFIGESSAVGIIFVLGWFGSMGAPEGLG